MVCYGFKVVRIEFGPLTVPLETANTKLRSDPEFSIFLASDLSALLCPLRSCAGQISAASANWTSSGAAEHDARIYTYIIYIYIYIHIHMVCMYIHIVDMHICIRVVISWQPSVCSFLATRVLLCNPTTGRKKEQPSHNHRST